MEAAIIAHCEDCFDLDLRIGPAAIWVGVSGGVVAQAWASGYLPRPVARDSQRKCRSGSRLIACYVPMHTATRITLELLPSLRSLNPKAHFCAYGLYAPMAAQSLQALGVKSLFGGEFEQALVDLAEHLSGLSPAPQIHPLDSNISLARLRFTRPIARACRRFALTRT